MVKNSRKYNIIYRCTIIVWMAIKFIFQIYSFHMRNRIWDERTKKKWNNLLIRMAKEYRKNAVKLGGVLIKVGQFLGTRADIMRSEEHTSELQSRGHLVCRLLLEKKKTKT